MFTPWRIRLSTLAALTIVVAVLSAGLTPVRSQLHTQDAVWAYRDAHRGESVPVIVQAAPGADAAQLVRAAGGDVRSTLGLIGGVAASVPGDQLQKLAASSDVAWMSLDGGITSLGGGKNSLVAADGAVAQTSVYPQEIHADKVWNDGNYGQGVGVVVLDTGVVQSDDFVTSGNNRLAATIAPAAATTADGYGHGSHVAGLIGGDGSNSNGKYTGVAPQVNLISVRAGDDSGVAQLSDVINGLQWVLDNKDAYNIRVVNLSLRSDVAQSYTTDPLDAAVELLTFRGILVVVAAGNTGTVADAVSYAPANDPFVLTVGALDDMGTPEYRDDVVPAWSSRGVTQDGFAKPDVYVPGRRLISVLSTGSVLATEYPDNVVGTSYFQLSGTSMAAGVASGAAALVFQAHPDWTPFQAKSAILKGSVPLPANSGVRVEQVDRVIGQKFDDDDGALPVIKPNYLLLEAAGIADPQSISWGSISWGSISWGSISWGSISWGSISWGSISWGSAGK